MNLVRDGKQSAALVAGISVFAVFALTVVRLCGFVAEFSVDLLFEDQWDLLRPVFESRGALTRFLWRHGPHRQGLGGVIQGVLYPATHWNVRAESWAAVVILILAAIAGVLLFVRLRGHLSWADAGIPLLILSPVHWETMLLTPNIAHSILPLLLILLLALAWTTPIGWGRVGAVATCAGLCLFTGFALCGALVAFAAVVLLGIRRGGKDSWGQQTVLIGLCIALLAGFTNGYRWDPAAAGWYFPVKPAWRYAEFVALMFTSLIGWRTISVGSLVAGCSVFALVFLLSTVTTQALWQKRDDRCAQIIWVLTGTSLSYAALTAVGRLPINVEAAFMWRYTTLMMPGVLGLGLAATVWIPSLSSIASGHRAHSSMRPCLLGLSGVVWIVLCGAVWFQFAPERGAAATAEAKRRWIASYRLTHDLAKANTSSHFWVYFPAPESPAIKARLDFLEAHKLSFFSSSSTEAEKSATKNLP